MDPALAVREHGMSRVDVAYFIVILCEHDDRRIRVPVRTQFEPRGEGDLAAVVVDRDPTVNKTLDQLNLAILPLDAPKL